MVATTTPNGVNKHIRELCRRLDVDSDPRFLPVLARDDSGLGDCFNDVKRHVVEHGGSLVHGWMLWEWPGVLVEAEFHGVWRSPSGELIDVTKKGDGETEILFVPDEVRIYEGSRIDNVRHAVGKNPKIQTFIQTQNRFYKLFSERHGNLVGEVELDDELAEMAYRNALLAEELATSSEAMLASARFTKQKFTS